MADQWRLHVRLHPKWRCDQEGHPTRTDSTNMEASRMERIHARCGYASYLLCGSSPLFCIVVRASRVYSLVPAQIPSNVCPIFASSVHMLNYVPRLYL